MKLTKPNLTEYLHYELEEYFNKANLSETILIQSVLKCVVDKLLDRLKEELTDNKVEMGIGFDEILGDFKYEPWFIVHRLSR